ncbi:DEAD/DEAH box helicase [Aneurinibacillus tyrosinisolvens]|uniref:DEAD/DEAH box helicase n=1 Tax=Aneurinibacillus tyrosinisolvens TaxID=1443435 RepID=UPI00063EFC0D|nr:DEAD/DEAH box helicase [Aneurinibacillus tyrosinisolvens]
MNGDIHTGTHIWLHGMWLGDSFFLFGRYQEKVLPVEEWLDSVFTEEWDDVLDRAKVSVREFQLPEWTVRGVLKGAVRQQLPRQPVSGIALPVADALSLLNETDAGEMNARGIMLADDFLFWQRTSLFVLELLLRGRFMPGIETENGDFTLEKYFQPVWYPNLDLEQDHTRFHLLAENMPPSCRSYYPKNEKGWSESAPHDVLFSFVTRAIDCLVHRWGCQEEEMQEAGKENASSLPPAVRWFQGLRKKEDTGVFVGNRADVDRLQADIEDWIGPPPLPGRRPATGTLRLCFRLEPPVESEAEWRLQFFLQPPDEPSLLISAEQIWRQQGDEMVYLSRRFYQVQETLLLQLARASRLYPLLARALENPRPQSLELDIQGAYHFLAGIAASLKEAGFGVLLPSWWTSSGRRRLGVKVKVRNIGSSSGKPVSEARLGLNQLVQFDARAAIGNDEISEAELRNLAALKAPLVQMRGQWVEVNPQQLEQALDYFTRKPEKPFQLADLLYMVSDTERETNRLFPLPVASFELPKNVQDFLEGKIEITGYEVPEQLKGELRPYQKIGYAWMAAMTDMGFGVCLADDMGLGKTVQVISLLLRKQEKDTALILCPTSLLGNWQRELERFAPSLRVAVHHGQGRAHGEDFNKLAAAHDIILSTYHMAYRDESELSAINWDYLVLDEAQSIKNSSARMTQSVQRLRAVRRIAMTGTPVENRLGEIWSLFQFLNPGYLGSPTRFRSRFAVPIERFKDKERAETLRKLMKPFILRRIKTDPDIIQDLPEKIEMKTFCTLTAEQASLYQATVNRMLGQAEEAQGIQRRGVVLATLTRLKQICDHPALYVQDESTASMRSGKLIRLLGLLRDIRENGDAALIFTQFREMGEILVKYIANELKEKPQYLHGGVRKKDRDALIEQFQRPDGPGIFVLSLKAGGVGLNLTRANHVIHFDRWWNPAVENQATDRAFRIGQSKNVQVHKFICQGTLEERIDQVIESKRDLSERIIGEGDGWITELSNRELRELLELREEVLQEEEEGTQHEPTK